MTRKSDVVTGAVLLILAVFYFGGTIGLPAGEDAPGPGFLPRLLATALFVLSAVLLAQGLGRNSAPEAAPPARRETRRGIATILLTAVYVGALTTLGFAISTWCYTCLVTLTLGQRRPIRVVAIPTVSTLFIYLLFEIALGTRLPPGFWAS